jgi:hypothetical protein
MYCFLKLSTFIALIDFIREMGFTEYFNLRRRRESKEPKDLLI